MKIAFIGQKGIPVRFGGVEAHVDAIATRLAARGHEVDVYVRNWYTNRALQHYRDVKLRHVPTIKTKHLDATVHSFLATLDGVVRGYDILHYHTVGPGAFAMLPALTGARSVLTVHSLDWQRAKWTRPAQALMKLGALGGIRFATEVIAVSGELARYVEERCRRRVSTIPNGVELPPEAPSSSRDILTRLGVAPGRYLLFLGRFVPEKRLERLVDAFREVVASGRRDLALVLGGDANGDYARRVRKRAEGLPCFFPGIVENEVKEALLSNARLAVLPSELEGFPIFLLEAMSRGVASVASGLPPHRELLGQGRGHLFEDDLRGALERALEASPVEQASMAEAGRRYVETHHSWDRIVEATEAVYERAAGSEARVTA